MNEGGSMADNFEKDWKKALDNIEISPDPIVWDRVNHSLAENELIYYKKRATIYKWAAMIAVLMAISLSISQFLRNSAAPNFSELTAEQVLTSDTESVTSTPSMVASVSSISVGEIKESPKAVLFIVEDKENADGNGGVIDTKRVLASNQFGSFAPFEVEKKNTEATLVGTKRFVPNLTIYRKADYSAVLASIKEPNKTDKRFWAGLGVGSSSFDPNYQLNQPNDVVSAVMRSESNFVSSVPEAQSQEATFSDRITEGVNYQFGVNMGVMLGNRLSLESGFNYAEAQLASHTDLIVENKIFAKSIAVTSEMVATQQVSQVTNTQDIIEYERSDISLDNTFQFASIPVKAGYQIVNKKIQVKLNAGFITNIYMGNTLTDESNQVASLQLFPGANSPYRTVSFSGITGISVGYNLFNSLDLTLEPNFSQALQPLTKEESNFNATPNGFGMIAGLRYRFGN